MRRKHPARTARKILNDSGCLKTLTAASEVSHAAGFWGKALAARHYLGPINRGWGYRDEFGVLVVSTPTSRRIPTTWLELSRWCLFGVKNGGSRQWKAARAWIAKRFPAATTIVSYSDPSVGHTGALYRACGWLWAPTWHRLRPPPSGNGDWGTGAQAVKDRWVFCLRPDAQRETLLRIRDDSIVRTRPWAQYREGIGGDYRRFANQTQ